MLRVLGFLKGNIIISTTSNGLVTYLAQWMFSRLKSCLKSELVNSSLAFNEHVQ